jgi:hypothetical protein
MIEACQLLNSLDISGNDMYEEEEILTNLDQSFHDEMARAQNS